MLLELVESTPLYFGQLIHLHQTGRSPNLPLKICCGEGDIYAQIPRRDLVECFFFLNQALGDFGGFKSCWIGLQILNPNLTCTLRLNYFLIILLFPQKTCDSFKCVVCFQISTDRAYNRRCWPWIMDLHRLVHSMEWRTRLIPLSSSVSTVNQ